MPLCSKCEKEIADDVELCEDCQNSRPDTEEQIEEQETSLESPEEEKCVAAQSIVEDLSLWGYFIKCYKRFKDFSGRARRKEYLSFVLFYILAYIGLSIIGFLVRQPNIAMIYVLVSIVPYLAVTIRRLHDIDRSGWTVLFYVIPLIAFIGALVWATLTFDIVVLIDPSFIDAIPSSLIALLVSLVLYIAACIYLLCLMLKRGNIGANKYGEDPK